MEYTARLVHGPHSLDLNDGTYSVFDFDFPTELVELSISSGSSANRFAGGRVTGRKFSDRNWAPSIMITGASVLETSLAARRLRDFLELTADTRYEMYFEYMPHRAYSAVPVWGQDRLRFHIKYGRAMLDASYYIADVPQKILVVPLDLLIGPNAVGLRQRLASAKGCIIEDTLGTTDGAIRGTIVAPSITNKITNPVFGHATWNNGWLVWADLVGQKNTDMEHVLWGSVSAKVTRVGTGSNYKLLQIINVGNTNTHQLMAYVKKLDGTAVTAADARLFYNDHLPTTYTPCGGGWYQLTASVTGINASIFCGVAIWALNTPMFIAGVQLAESSTVVPFIYGDMLGCSWTGTPHASTSTSTAGYVRIPTAGILSAGGGTIRMAVRHLSAYDRAGNGYLFSDGTFWAAYNQSVDKWQFSDGTDTIGGAGAAQSFATGDIQILHFVWGPAGKQIYLNGALYATSATLAAWSVGDYLYIGSTNTPNQHFNGTILGTLIFDVPLTAAEIAADYAQASAHVRGGDGCGQRLDAIPWLWTKDGDNQVDNCNDSTRDNWAVCAGIPGNVEADTTFQLETSNGRTVAISRFDTHVFVDPGVLYADDFSEDTNTADATCSGGDYHRVIVGVNQAVAFPAAGVSNRSILEEIFGREYYMAMRIYDEAASDTLYIQGVIYNGGQGSIIGEPRAVSASRAWRLLRTHPVYVPQFNRSIIPFRNYSYLYYMLPLIARSGSKDYVRFDYICAVPRPVVRIGSLSSFIVPTATNFVYNGMYADAVSSAGFEGAVDVSGDPVALVPGKYNALISFIGMDAANAATITWTLTYTGVYIIPRWGLM